MKRVFAVFIAVAVLAGIMPVGIAAVSMRDLLSEAVCASGVELTVENDDNATWEAIEDETRKCVRSAGVTDASSGMTLSVELEAGQAFLFDYKMTQEQGDDTLKLLVTFGETTSSVTLSGTHAWKQYGYVAEESGTYTFAWAYVKSSATEQFAYIDNVQLADNAELTAMMFTQDGVVVNKGDTQSISIAPIPFYATLTDLRVTACDENIVTAGTDGNMLTLTGISQGRTFVTVTAGNDVTETIYVSVTDDLVASGFLSYSPGETTGWSDFDFTTDTIGLLHQDSTTIYAGEYYNGDVYFWEGGTGNIFILDTQTWERTKLCTTTTVSIMRDMAYDYSTDTMYFIALGADPEKVYLEILDLGTGKITVIDEVVGMGETPLTLSCSTDGILYSVENTEGGFYTIDKNTAVATFVGNTGFTPQFIQSSAYNHTTDALYWAMCNLTEDSLLYASLGSIDTNTGKAETISDAAGQISCFYFEYYEERDMAAGIAISKHETELYAGENETISAAVLPEVMEHRVYWISSDTSIVTVDGDGIIVPLAEGKATVTAISENGGYTDICEINVLPRREAVVIFEDDFEDGISSWTMIDGDGDGECWNHQTDSENAHSGNGMISSTSYNYYLYEGVEADNMLVSPELPVCENTILSWYARESVSDWLDNYEVYVRINQNFAEPRQLADTDICVYSGTPTADALWSRVDVNLSEYAGMTIQIIIRHIDTQKDTLYIDDISLWYYANTVHTVTFVDANGETVTTARVGDGQSVMLPAAPILEGYVFLYWDGEYQGVSDDTTVTAVYGLLGDANADDTVNTGDAVAVLRHTVGIAELSEYQLIMAELTGDGNVNTGDAVAILRLCIES